MSTGWRAQSAGYRSPQRRINKLVPEHLRPTKPSEWLDHADPASAQIALLFAPNIIADDYVVGAIDGAGNGQLSSSLSWLEP